jgi:hypothetical protein
MLDERYRSQRQLTIHDAKRAWACASSEFISFPRNAFHFQVNGGVSEMKCNERLRMPRSPKALAAMLDCQNGRPVLGTML